MARQKHAKPETNIVVKRENGAVVVRIPVNYYRRKGRQMVLASGDASGDQQPAPAPSHTLIANLAKAYRWQEQLESGEYSTLDELGKSLGVDRTYVSRILQLTSLSPPLVERILSGDEPPGLSIESLRNAIPEIWDRQVWA